MTDKSVELIRRFTPMSSRSAEWDFLMAGNGKPQRWHEIEDAFRVLIIADPAVIRLTGVYHNLVRRWAEV